ncbi:MAG: glycosyltransferase family 2 protein [Gaiellaceae bacterium MAG52_C11]|nr:glycosyltransferase family 2 protein [Candidatus Gaiellasilicea maunaloa]
MRPSDRHPHVSILLVSWNTRELTEACLATLPASVAPSTEYETIVVDNGSTDGSLDLLRGRDDIQLIENGANVGFAAAVNQAYARSTGRLVLLLNSDIEFKPGALEALVVFLAEHPDVAGVGPLYLNPDGSPQQHHFRLPTFGMFLASSSSPLRSLPGLSTSERRYRMLGEDFSQPRPVEQPSASVLLLRREVLPPDHLLDERFPIYFNDVELAYRLTRAGHELWMTPASEVFHVHGASTRQLGANLRRQHLASLVCYLQLTQPRSRVAAFRAFVFAQKAALRLLRRPGTLPLGELVRALRGEPGPLPQAPRG